MLFSTTFRGLIAAVATRALVGYTITTFSTGLVTFWVAAVLTSGVATFAL